MSSQVFNSCTKCHCSLSSELCPGANVSKKHCPGLDWSLLPLHYLNNMVEKQKLKGEKGKMLNGWGVCETGPIFRRRSSYETSRLCTANCIVSLHFTPSSCTWPQPWVTTTLGSGDPHPQNIWGPAILPAAPQLIQIKSEPPPCKRPLFGAERGPHCLLPELINDTATIATC